MEWLFDGFAVPALQSIYHYFFLVDSRGALVRCYFWGFWVQLGRPLLAYTFLDCLQLSCAVVRARVKTLDQAWNFPKRYFLIFVYGFRLLFWSFSCIASKIESFKHIFLASTSWIVTRWVSLRTWVFFAHIFVNCFNVVFNVVLLMLTWLFRPQVEGLRQFLIYVSYCLYLAFWPTVLYMYPWAQGVEFQNLQLLTDFVLSEYTTAFGYTTE